MQTEATDFADWMRLRQERMEAVLEGLLPAASVVPFSLHQAMRYAVLGGGKRVRPLLAFAAGEAAGAQAPHVERAAAAVELIHAYSLVHDDLPCMDDDVLRRGKPTCHVAFDEATALLVGDALQSLAFQCWPNSRSRPRRRRSSRWCVLWLPPPGRAAWRAGRRSTSPAPAASSPCPSSSSCISTRPAR